MAKATKKQALGRGLSALLKDTSSNVKDNHDIVGNIIEVALETIQVNPYQPRTYFDEDSLASYLDLSVKTFKNASLFASSSDMPSADSISGETCISSGFDVFLGVTKEQQASFTCLLLFSRTGSAGNSLLNVSFIFKFILNLSN